MSFQTGELLALIGLSGGRTSLSGWNIIIKIPKQAVFTA
jgi:hypothetical protein